MFSARVVRQNFTFLYQHLAVANILPVVVENGIITEAKRKEVESYTQKYAQSIVVIGALFLWECPPDGLVRLTDVLAMTTGQEQVARKLLDGRNIIPMLVVVLPQYQPLEECYESLQTKIIMGTYKHALFWCY